MKLLNGPYGWNSYDGAVVRMFASERVEPDDLIGVLRQYSCHEPAIPKIVSCLNSSGRYDTILQDIWYRQQYKNVTRDLAGIGVRLEHIGYLKDGILNH